MTNELKKVTNQINKEIIKYFIKDISMEAILIIETMINNDYNVKIIVKEINKEVIISFEQFLNEISQELITDNITINYYLLKAPINHVILNNKKNTIMSTVLYAKEQIEFALPIISKYQNEKKYKIQYGLNYFKTIDNINYTKKELINICNNYINILKSEEYKYFKLEIKNNQCNYNYFMESMTDDELLDYCFYIVNRFINYLIKYCKFNNYVIPEDKMIFCIRFLGKENVSSSTLFLLDSIIYQYKFMLKKIFKDPKTEILNLLEAFKVSINNFDNVFIKEPKDKVKKIKG